MKSYSLYRSTRKEFSNDPAVEIAEISDLFQLKMVSIQNDLQILKQMYEDSSRHMVKCRL